MNAVYSLYKINHWWQAGDVEPFYLHKRIRSEFSDIVKDLENNKIEEIVGPVCTGKTTLLYQTVDYLLKLNVPQKRIVMFGGDDAFIFGEYRSIGSILEAYTTQVLHEDIYALKSPVYVLIDDIEFIEDWQIYLVNYLAKAARLKFIIVQTMSSGRLDELLPANLREKITVMPLSQQQFSEFYSAYKETDFDVIKYKSMMPKFSVFENTDEYCDILSQSTFALNSLKPTKAQIIDEYLRFGGFPAYFESSGSEHWPSALRYIIDRGLYCDVVLSQSIKSPQKLKKLLYFIAAYGGHEQAYGTLGRALYVDTATIISYVSGLCAGGYTAVAENYSQNAAEGGHVIRKNKRIYVLDLGIRNFLLRAGELTHEYEKLVINSCFLSAYTFAAQNGGSVFFWKDGRRDVDIVLEIGGELTACSVQYEKQLSDHKLKALKAFMKAEHVQNSIVVTKDVLKHEDGICYIPFWLI